jgi:hypothetical protein
MVERSPGKTLLLILVPMLAVATGQRFYLHLIPIRHVYVVTYLIHHLFTGVLIVVPAAFVLAFGAYRGPSAFLAPVALGIGSGMVLDEVAYLVATDGSDAGYRSAVSLWGAVTLLALATALLLGLYGLHRRAHARDRRPPYE